MRLGIVAVALFPNSSLFGNSGLVAADIDSGWSGCEWPGCDSCGPNSWLVQTVDCGMLGWGCKIQCELYPSPPPPPSPPPMPPMCFVAMDLALVLDNSGSMTAAAVAAEKELARGIIEQFSLFSHAVRATIVSFESTPTTQIGLSTDRDAVNGAISAITTTSGGTDISAALNTAKSNFAASPRATARKIVFLMSDGINGAGDAVAISAAAVLKAEGIELYVAGFAGAQQVTSPHSLVLVSHIGR